jgi:hypothetical protein
MARQQPARSPRGVHEADIARLAAAQQVIARAHAELVADAGTRVTPADRRWAHIYVSRVLAADDDTGRRDGWITRGDLVRWIDLLALGRAAARQLDPGHDGEHVVDCEACALSLAVRRLREAAVNAGWTASRPSTAIEDP